MNALRTAIKILIAFGIGIAGMVLLFGENASLMVTILCKPLGIACIYLCCRIIENIKKIFHFTKSN